MSAAGTSDPLSDVAAGTMFGLTATDLAGVAALLLALITFIGLLITRRQNRATVLFEMDRRWNCSEMLEARQLVRNLRDDLIELVASKHAHLDDAHKADRLSIEFAVALAEMRKQNRDSYALALRYCGFFETVGLMARRRYISLDDIDDLFHGPIMAIDECFRAHIAQRQSETGVSPGMFENALYLADLVKKRSTRRT